LVRESNSGIVFEINPFPGGTEVAGKKYQGNETAGSVAGVFIEEIK
jgi:hypothetical protein